MRRALILAAGKGSRMKSDYPKVCQKIHGKTFLTHLIETLTKANVTEIYPIVGYQKETVISVHNLKRYFVQNELTGTATAVKAARSTLAKQTGATLIMAGDTPLVKIDTILNLFKKHEQEQNAMTFITIKQDFKGYGHVLRDKEGNVCGQVEDHDATDAQKKIQELNVSVYCFDNLLLFTYLDQIENNNSKQEFYINDMMEILYKNGFKVETMQIDDYHEVMGVNDPETLRELEQMTK